MWKLKIEMKKKGIELGSEIMDQIMAPVSDPLFPLKHIIGKFYAYKVFVESVMRQPGVDYTVATKDYSNIMNTRKELQAYLDDNSIVESEEERDYIPVVEKCVEDCDDLFSRIEARLKMISACRA